MKKNTAKPTSAKPTTSALRFSHEEISGKAQALWRQKGCPDGQDDLIWLEAEKALSHRIPTFDDAGVTSDLDRLFPDPDSSSPTAL
jgi:hypothetical protein